MITEAERNYKPKQWQAVDSVPPGSEGLALMGSYYFCNTDSQRFQDLIARGVADRAVLLDYELINLGHDPLNGSQIMKTPGGHYILTIFTDEGPAHYIEVVKP